jgi:hypothetical protein
MDQTGLTHIPSTPYSLSIVEVVQNPGLGATLIWSATSGHYTEVGAAFPLHLAFLVLPMVLHFKTRNIILDTYKSSGLAKFAFKFKGHEDELLAIHTRALVLRTLTLDSLSAAFASNLLSLDYTNASLLPTRVRGRPPQTQNIESMLDAAAKLGHWFARLPLRQITSMLRVEL